MKKTTKKILEIIVNFLNDETDLYNFMQEAYTEDKGDYELIEDWLKDNLGDDIDEKLEDLQWEMSLNNK